MSSNDDWCCPECGQNVTNKRIRGPHLSGCRRKKNAKWIYDDEKDPQHKHPRKRIICATCKEEAVIKAVNDRPAKYCSTACSQVGDGNSMWKGKGRAFEGSHSQYIGCHNNVRSKYGTPSYCAWADDTCKGKFSWANISGDYYDVDDFIRLCMSHNMRFDADKEGNMDQYDAKIRAGIVLRDFHWFGGCQ